MEPLGAEAAKRMALELPFEEETALRLHDLLKRPVWPLGKNKVPITLRAERLEEFPEALRSRAKEERGRYVITWGAFKDGMTREEAAAVWDYVNKAMRVDIKGVAVVVGRREDGLSLAAFDVDDPSAVDKIKDVVERGLCYKTGARCPHCLREGKWHEAKDGVECALDKCVHKKCGREFSLKDAPRGITCLVLTRDTLDGYPATIKLDGGKIEVHLRDHLVALPPSYHPSGVSYEWVGEPREPPVVEIKPLLPVEAVLPQPAKAAAAAPRVEAPASLPRPPCIAKIEEMGRRGELKGHYPWFVYASYWARVKLWLRGYRRPKEAKKAPEDVRHEVAEEVIEMLRQFPQFNEREARRQVEHVLGLRGSRTVYLAPKCARIQAAKLCVDSCPLKGVVKSPLAFLKKSLIQCSSQKSTRPAGSKKRNTEAICNTPWGIVYRKYKFKDGVPTVEDTVLAKAYLQDVTVIHSPIIDVDYVNAVVRNVDNPNDVTPFHMVRVDVLVNYVNKRFRRLPIPDWRSILNVFPRITDFVFSGLACPPLERYKLPCGVRDYFNAGLLKSVERHEARQVFENFYSTLAKFAPNDLWLKQVMTGFTFGSFQNFMFTRKLHQQRAQLVVFEGPARTGKSTAARALLYSFYPNYVDELFIPGGSQVTPARIGRAQDTLVTGLLVFDEVENMMKYDETVKILKTYATNLIGWRTAYGEKYPAWAGLILTANSFYLPDPALNDKIVTIPMTEQIPRDKAKTREFNAKMPWRELVKFGSYYLLYAEKNWETAQELILSEDVAAPKDYFNTVLEDLGLNPLDLLNPDEPPVPSALEKYMSSLHDEAIKVATLQSQRDARLTEIIEKGIFNGTIKLARQYFRGKEEYVRIPRNEAERIGVNIEQLCKELGGELLTNLGGDYYKSCIVPLAQFRDAVERFLSMHED